MDIIKLKSQITKNQHYIPQFILRCFAMNPAAKKEKQKIRYIDLKSNKKNDGKIKNNFSEDYFYDVDNYVENHLRDTIETPVALVVDEIKNGKTVISTESKCEIIKFISIQYSRTPAAEEDFIDYINFSYSKTKSKIDFYEDGFRIQPSDDDSQRQIRAMLTGLGEYYYSFLIDLDLCIIRNNTAHEFIISDHPVVIINWLAMKENMLTLHYKGTGIQVFMPISPDICLFLYDRSAYRVRQENKALSIDNPEDVFIINSFQIRNARDKIAFRNDSDVEHILRLIKKYHGKKIGKNSVVDLIDNRTLIHKKQERINNIPSFFKFKKGILCKNHRLR